MRRFRTQWLAFLGALVILSLSLSSAFGARPTVGSSQVTGFGQQVSTFVHVLLSGTNDEDESGDEDQDQDQGEDSGDPEECQPASDEDGSSGDETDGDETPGDETTGDETSGETTGDETTGDETGGETGGETTGDETGDQDQTCDGQPEGDSGDDSGDTSGDGSGGDAPDSAPQNHGQCVATVAHSDAVGDNGTHGWAVALAAQITCWLELNGSQSPDAGGEDAGSTAGSGTNDASPTSSTKPHGKSEAAHQRKLDRGKGKPDWASAAKHGSHGKGHGKGHNR